MGAGIAQVAASAGFHVTAIDSASEQLAVAREVIARDLSKHVSAGKLGADDAETIMGRLTFSSDLAEAAASADFVIEAVSEDISVKCKLFRELVALTGGGSIIATNTSSLSITEIAAASGRPRNVIGMHFFNPPTRMRLVEVIRGLETSNETAESTVALAKRMGKETVEVNDSPAFVVSRINAVIGNEAFRILAEGVATAETIDRAVKLGLNHPMGPFELGDLVGWDVRLSVLRYMEETLGDAYRASPLLVQYAKAGRLGRKSGRGVYAYDDRPTDSGLGDRNG